MAIDAATTLALHRELVRTRSVSGKEGAAAELVASFLADRLRGGEVEIVRLGATVLALARADRGPLLLFDSHLDTVPPNAAWTRDPWGGEVHAGKVYGLGANDAKASVAAMSAAFVRLAGAGSDAASAPPLALALVEAEETNGAGTQKVLAELAARGLEIAAAVVGEPTGLDLAIAQKGLAVLELIARGDACHAAHARALGARNAALVLARDLVALEGLDFDPECEGEVEIEAENPNRAAVRELGGATVVPTVVRAGEARNAVPALATAVLDVRTVPGLEATEVAARIAALVEAEVRIVSDRLRPRAVEANSRLVRAALAARAGFAAAGREGRSESLAGPARLYGSRTLSDWALLGEIPAVKCGPGESERSHAADEFVFEREILAGAEFYAALARRFAEEAP